MSLFKSPEQLAEWAEGEARKSDYYRFTVFAPHERVMLMLDHIHRVHYHIIAPDIRKACEIRAGFASN